MPRIDRRHFLRLSAALAAIRRPLSSTAAAPDDAVRWTPFPRVRVADAFWTPRLDVNRRVTIPHNFDKCEEVGIIENFRRAGGLSPGGYLGLGNWDEFLYKTVEAAACVLQQAPDAALEARVDAAIAAIAAAQEPDGYLRTNYTIALERQRVAGHPARWDNERHSIELYMAGHLYEAAVAHAAATGKRTLLDVAVRNALLVDRVFGPGRRRDVPGHQEIELALVRLYEQTGEPRWWRLAKFFLDERGRADGHTLYGSFSQDHQPVVEQEEAVGQAPRATYMYSGMADIAAIDGDAAYRRALDRLWDDVVTRKMYVTGGIGSRHDNEGFDRAHVLPNREAYAEPCAAVSFTMWNVRMFRLRPHAKYVDVVERTIYNNLLAGVSLSGDRYFYACPLESDGRYLFNLGWFPKGYDHLPYSDRSATRKEWFPSACCPPNVARYLPQIPGFAYATRGDELFVNLFIGSTADVRLRSGSVRIVQETRYPWDGHVSMAIHPAAPTAFPLRVRIPGWAREAPVPGDLYRFADAPAAPAGLAVNGRRVPLDIEDGYVRIARTWQAGDRVELTLPMPMRRLVSHPAVEANRGRVALQRGPLVFAVEGADHGGRVLDLSLPRAARLQAAFEPGLLGGVVTVTGEAVRRGGARVALRAIPYFAWSNRGAGEMAVWLPTPD